MERPNHEFHISELTVGHPRQGRLNLLSKWLPMATASTDVGLNWPNIHLTVVTTIESPSTNRENIRLAIETKSHKIQ